MLRCHHMFCLHCLICLFYHALEGRYVPAYSSCKISIAKVTERKHRLVKSAALFVFRSLEHTTLAHILNAQCEQVIEGHSLFQKRFLVRPSHLDISDIRCTRSSTMVLECGMISKDDIVYTRGGFVVRAVCFWEIQGHFTMQCKMCMQVSGYVYEHTVHPDSFIACDDIVEPMAYRPFTNGSFRILLPWKAQVL